MATIGNKMHPASVTPARVQFHPSLGCNFGREMEFSRTYPNLAR